MKARLFVIRPAELQGACRASRMECINTAATGDHLSGSFDLSQVISAFVVTVPFPEAYTLSDACLIRAGRRLDLQGMSWDIWIKRERKL